MSNVMAIHRKTSIPTDDKDRLARRFTKDQLSGYSRTEVDSRWLLTVSSGTGLIRPEKLENAWVQRAGSSAIKCARMLRNSRMLVKTPLPRNEVAHGIRLAFESRQDAPIRTGNRTVDGVAEIARMKLWNLPINRGYVTRERKSLSFTELARLVIGQLDYQGYGLGPQIKN